jgi:hypothetical protein
VSTPSIAGSPTIGLAFIGDESDNSVTIIDPPSKGASAGPVARAPRAALGTATARGPLGAPAAVTLGSLARDPRGTALPPVRAAALGDALAPPPAQAPVKHAKTPRTTR